jgi:GT2 family glycosyltransferase
MTADDVAIVIPNFNGRHLIDSCLAAVAAQSTPPTEVVVVDNGSTDGSVEHLRATWPGVGVERLVENRGFAGGANHGVRATSTSLVAVLNSDAEPEPDWLAELLAAPRPDDVWAWGSVLVATETGRIESAGDLCNLFAMASKHLRGRPLEDLPDEPYEVFAAPGAAPLFRRAVFDELGGYHERFFLYYEDIDLAFRARLLGHRALMVPTARVHHRLGASGTLGRTRYFVARNSLWTAVRNLPRPGPRVLWRATQRAFRDARRHHYVVPFVRGRLAGVAGLPRAFAERRQIQRGRRVSDEQVRAFLSPPAADR